MTKDRLVLTAEGHHVQGPVHEPGVQGLGVAALDKDIVATVVGGHILE